MTEPTPVPPAHTPRTPEQKAAIWGGNAIETFPDEHLAPALTEHHTPNVLPDGHTRDDYDFTYADGVAGPIRLVAVNEPTIPIRIPAKVWCKRHGWEVELDGGDPR